MKLISKWVGNMRIYTLYGNTNKYYYAQILNSKSPYYLDFVHISETRTKPLLIGDYCELLKATKLKKNETISNSSPTFSQKAFDCLKELLIPQSEEVIELRFEDRFFYLVVPKLMTFTDRFNWPLVSQELPPKASFFRAAPDLTWAYVTQEFKDICDKHKLKGMCFELKYDSEATP